MALKIGSIIRHYRFIVAAFACLLIIFFLSTSESNVGTSQLSQPVKVQPVDATPGFINTGDQMDTALQQAIESQQRESQTSDSSVPQVNQDSAKDIAGSTSGDKSVISSSASCDKPHEYVVMIDAGSTGSRVHVYEFDVCPSIPALIHETFEMLKPGLSSFDTDVEGAAKSLDPLLKTAMDVVPVKLQGCTPVAVKATAGLRILGEQKAQNILAAVRKRLETQFPFAVVEGDGVSMMGGDDEGVYAWITANFLLGNIGGKSKLPTAAVFDLGGGSTQIVFEPTFEGSERMVEGEHKYELTFGGNKYTLYQFSHLGYGLMQGRNKVNGALVSAAIEDGRITKNVGTHKLKSPCIPEGMTAEETVKIGDETYRVSFTGTADGGTQCRYLAERILNKDAACIKPPCSFNGVHQPSLVKAFHETSDMYVFSYFYDKTRPLGMPLSFTVKELTDMARNVCEGQTKWTEVFSAVTDSLTELKSEPQWCLDLSFQAALLHTGYDIPMHRELKTAQTIANNELGWCLGASLPLLDKTNWKCRVKQIA